MNILDKYACTIDDFEVYEKKMLEQGIDINKVTTFKKPTNVKQEKYQHKQTSKKAEIDQTKFNFGDNLLSTNQNWMNDLAQMSQSHEEEEVDNVMDVIQKKQKVDDMIVKDDNIGKIIDDVDDIDDVGMSGNI